MSADIAVLLFISGVIFSGLFFMFYKFGKLPKDKKNL